MPRLYNKKAKKEVEVDPVFVKESVESGDFDFVENEEYEFVDPDGQSRLVKGSQAIDVGALGYRLFDAFDEDVRQEALRKEARYGGAMGQAAAGTLSLARGLSLGLSDVALRAAGGEKVRQDLEGLEEQNPGTSLAGEIVGTIGGAVTGVGVVGALAKGGAKVGGKLAARGASKTVANTAAFALEGAVAGAGQAASDLAVHNKEVTAETIASELWKGAAGGAVLGGGAGLLVGSVSALGKALGKQRFRPTSFRTPRAQQMSAEIAESQAKLVNVLDDLKAAGNQPRTHIQRGSLAQRLRRIDETILQVEDVAEAGVVAELRATRKALKRQLGETFGERTVGAKKAAALADDVARFEQQADDVARSAGIADEFDAIRQSLPADAIMRRAPPKGPLPNRLKANFSAEALEDFSKSDFSKALNTARSVDSELSALGKADDLAAKEIHRIDRSLGKFSGDKEKSMAQVLNELGLQRAASDVSELGPVGDKMIRIWAAQREDLITTVAKATREANKKVGVGLDAAANLVPGPKAVKSLARGAIEGSLGAVTLPLSQMDRGFNLIRRVISKGQQAETRIAKAATALKKGARKAAPSTVGFQHRKALDALSGKRSKTLQASYENAERALRAASKAPETFDADANELLRPVALADPEVAAQARVQHVRGMQYLNEHLPKNPFPGRIHNYKPPRSEMASFARRARGVLDPIGTLEAVARGEVLAESVEAIAETRPALFLHFQQQLLSNVEELSQLPVNRRQLLATLFRVPIDATNLPRILANSQVHFAQAAQAAQPTVTRALPRSGDESKTLTQKLASGE